MELGHIISFILGGFISAIIFYPKKRKALNVDYIASVMAFWWFSGICFKQENPNSPEVKQAEVPYMATNKMFIDQFKQQAELFCKTIEVDK